MTDDIKSLESGTQLMTIEEISYLTKFDSPIILEWIDTNKLRAIKFGSRGWRVFKHDLVRMLNENANQ